MDAAAEQMLQAVSAALNLTGADLQRLKTDPRNADARVSAILGGRSIVETIFALEVELQDAEQDVAQLTSQIDMVQSALAMKQADLARLQGHASEMTPPQSPEMARKVMEEEHHAELEGQAAEAQRNLARERERVTELERRLAAFEAAADGMLPLHNLPHLFALPLTVSHADRSTAEVSTKAGSRAASSSGELVKKLMKEFSSVNSQISQLRDENSAWRLELQRAELTPARRCSGAADPASGHRRVKGGGHT